MREKGECERASGIQGAFLRGNQGEETNERIRKGGQEEAVKKDGERPT